MKKCLVIQLARFGDLMQTKRLISSLEAERAEVHLCLDHSLSALAQLVYPNCVLHPITAHASGLDSSSALLQLLVENRFVFNELQSLQFDEIYNLNFSGINFRLSALFDSDFVSGYRMRNGQEHISRWPEMAMRWARDRRIGLNLVDFWGYYSSHPIPGCSVNPPAAPGGGGLGVVLAGRESRRSLPMDLLARIVVTRHARSNAPVYLLGSTTESTAARALMRLLPSSMSNQLIDLTGKTDWKGLVDVLHDLDTVLTPDTGTMHLAAHLGVPVEAFFFSSAWCFETGPYGEGHTVYQAITECLPCLETQPCPYEIKCRHPFEGDQMLRYLSTHNPEHCPPGLLAYKSGFDSLGLIFTTSELDPDKVRRLRFRQFIAPHAGAASNIFEGSAATELAATHYLEKDWFM